MVLPSVLFNVVLVCSTTAKFQSLKCTMDDDTIKSQSFHELILGTMHVGTANSEDNPNSTYFNSKGMWFTYIIVVAIIHYVFLSLPFLSVAMTWTLTNVIHNMVRLSLDEILYLKHSISAHVCHLTH